MVTLGEDARVRLWIALGNQPGLSAWHAVWLLSRLMPHAPKPASRPESAAEPVTRPSRRVRAGTQAYQEQPRP